MISAFKCDYAYRFEIIKPGIVGYNIYNKIQGLKIFLPDKIESINLSTWDDGSR